ncbi:MAG: FAD-binding protein [Pirellulales bacterium]
MLPLDELPCDVLILGAGGAGMLAALHVTTANPAARIVIAVKGLVGQSSCTRMLQGSYNCFFPRRFSPILGSRAK